MAFELMTLPYSYDALEPYMSAETLHYHHDKHHQAYVDMLNKLLPGSGLEGKSLEQIVKASIAKTLIGCEAPFRKKSGTESNARHSLPFCA